METPSDSREKADEILKEAFGHAYGTLHPIMHVSPITEAMIKFAAWHHSNELSKVKGLPTDYEILKDATKYRDAGIGSKYDFTNGAKRMRDEFAEPLLASEKAKYDQLQSRYDELMRVAEGMEKAIQVFSLMNEDHYKDIAGPIKQAREYHQQFDQFKSKQQ